MLNHGQEVQILEKVERSTSRGDRPRGVKNSKYLIRSGEICLTLDHWLSAYNN